MNYFTLTERIQKLCKSHALIKKCYYNIYKIDQAGDIEYFASILTASTVSVTSQTIDCQYRLTVMDRMTNDRSNILEIQSTAINIIKNIFSALKQFEDMTVADSIQIETFEYQFADDCAGAIGTFSITIENENDCPAYKNGCFI